MVKKKICMLGSFGVGKTSLVARYVHSIFDDKYHTTVGVKIDKKVIELDGQEIRMMLWDMAGEEDNAPVKLHQVSDAAGYLLVVDGLRGKTLDVAVSIQERVATEIGPRPFLLLANKADEKDKWEIAPATWSELKGRGWRILETSAKSGLNVEEAFRTLAVSMLETSDDDGDED